MRPARATPGAIELRSPLYGPRIAADRVPAPRFDPADPAQPGELYCQQFYRLRSRFGIPSLVMSGLSDGRGIGASAQLRHPEGGKAYRGYIAMAEETESGEVVFVAWAAYGPQFFPEQRQNPLYAGPDLDAALQKLNAQLRSKLRPSSGYLPEPGGQGPEQIEREQFHACFLAALKER